MNPTRAIFSSFGVAILSLMIASCGRLNHGPITTYPAIGEVVAVRALASTTVVEKKFDALRIVLVLDGVELNFSDDVTFYFFKKLGDTTPLYTLHARDLASLPQNTGCSGERIKSLDNGLSSDTMICDGSVDLSEAGYFLAKRPNAKDRSATSYATTSIKNGVKSISIAFY